MPWDDPQDAWDQGSWDSDPDPAQGGPTDFISDPNINLSTTTTMQYWEVTKNRALETLPVWTHHLPTLNIGGKTPASLEALIDAFEPAAQAQSAQQDVYDGAYRATLDALARMKKLGTSVPQLIESQLKGNTTIMTDVADLYRTTPKSEATILKRLRDLLTVWESANAALAAMTPAQAPITFQVGATVYTAALAETLLNNYTTLSKTMKNEDSTLKGTKNALRVLDRETDDLNKRWYQAAKTMSGTNPALAAALEGITTESGTPAPDPYEINTLLQGGQGGLQALVSYLPGGGDHATTSLLKWMVEGVDVDFPHSAPLDPGGNTLGPFVVGNVVKVITQVSNSTGTRTSAVRTITITEPI